MKKRLFVIAAMAAFFSAPALADDAPIFNWSGVYVGGHGGYAWSDSGFLSNHVAGIGTCAGIGPPFFIVPCDPANFKTNGFAGGGQAGIRWQTSPSVFGVEGTWTATRLNARSPSPNVQAPDVLFYDLNVRNVYTVTAQVGRAFDRTLLYIKGGYAGAQLAVNSTVLSGGLFFPAPAQTRANGWTLGIGLEYAFLPNWSFGLEFNHISLSGDARGCIPGSGAFGCGPPPRLKYAGINDDIDMVLLRLNYRFALTGQ